MGRDAGKSSKSIVLVLGVLLLQLEVMASDTTHQPQPIP